MFPFQMRRLWLLFAQTVTVILALWFVVMTLKPEWLSQNKISFLLTDRPMMSRKTEQLSAFTGQNSYRFAVQQAIPAVVSLTTKTVVRNPSLVDPWFNYFFGEQGAESAIGLGSGVIVDVQGYILTNHHVVDAADEIEVVLADGRKTQAIVVGSDPETDLAVLKIDLPDLSTITLGHIEEAQVGDVVLAIGNPFAVGQTVTMGIISALGRNRLGINTFENFIQTDAAINPGSSGGALVDTSGNLLGINTAILSRMVGGGGSGIGFAVPVSTAKQVMDEIIATGSVTRGWIGIDPQEITAELAESFELSDKNGTLVAGVVRGSPADLAGLRPGDILLRVNDQAMNDTTTLLNTIAQLKPGSVVKLALERKRKKMLVKAVIGKRPMRLPKNTAD